MMAEFATFEVVLSDLIRSKEGLRLLTTKHRGNLTEDSCFVVCYLRKVVA